jgi:cytochrome b6
VTGGNVLEYFVLNSSYCNMIYDWCEERLEIQSLADDILAKFVPAHVNIFYCFGGIVLTSFIFQIASGFGLTMYYRPTVVEAFSSLQFLLYHVHLGWFIRSIHRWSSGIMVVCLILHISRVYLTGGFIKPREFIWITGVILALATVSFGVTGYSLAWDQVGYWACKIVTSVPEALDELIPHIGSTLVLWLDLSPSLSATIADLISASIANLFGYCSTDVSTI